MRREGEWMWWRRKSGLRKPAPCATRSRLSKRTTWLASSCHRAGRRSRTSCITSVRSVSSVADIRHRSGHSAAALGSGPCAASCHRGPGAGRAQDGPSLLAALRRAGRRRRSSMPSRVGWGVVHGVKAVAVDCVLRVGLLHVWFVEAKKPCPENPTFAHWWQTIEGRVLLCVEEVAGNHLKPPLVPFRRLHRPGTLPPVTSSQQFLDELATHLRITTGFAVPFDLKEHFSFTRLLP